MDGYDPKGHGKEKAVANLTVCEVEPPHHLSKFVHRYIKITTNVQLSRDYRFHALPDTCTYMVFNLLDDQITGVTKLHTVSEEFNLGKRFSYLNVRFYPAVWNLCKEPVGRGLVNLPYAGTLPLTQVNGHLIGCSFKQQQRVLTALVEQLIDENVVAEHAITQRIIQNFDIVNSVAEVASLVAMSTRQLQRVIRQATGFSPHEFLKILHLQRTMAGGSTDHYADQSHFIHSFKKATSYTPSAYIKKYDV